METMLVRLKGFDPVRGCVMRRYTYAGIKFQPERGWYRVEQTVAEYLKSVRQDPANPHSALAFDVMTDDEARALEAREQQTQRRSASEVVPMSAARVEARVEGAVTTHELTEDTNADERNADDRSRQKRKG
jgi:phage tail sheath gpL-like